MELSGVIKSIGQVQQVSATFRKIEIVVTTHEQYPQHILVEFSQDKCDLLNGFQIGQKIKVSINIRGREWTSPQGETRYFNSIQGWRIANDEPQGQHNVYQGQGSAVDHYQNVNRVAKPIPPSQAFAAPSTLNQPHQQHEMFNGNSEPSGHDDLPF